MSQRIKFSTGSYFEQMSLSEFSILLRGSIWNYLFGLGMGVVFIFIPIFMDNKINNSFYYFWFVPCGIAIISSLYSIFYYEKISVDLKSNELLKQKCIAGIMFKKVTLKWPMDSYYLNENIFDSYQRITRVWFIAKSEESKQSKRLIEFSSQKQYIEFIKILKEYNPKLIIKEWHD